jgi:DNA-directed RNA polymerase specialized sigma24 family protein
MRKDWQLTEDVFNKFLSWLHTDREEAGKKYEDIRRRLIIILTCRGCTEAEELADETINRVIRRAQEMADTYIGEPAPYFITVAHHLYLEYVAKHQVRSELLSELRPSQETDPEEELEYECLEVCIQGLTPANRDMVLQYYQENKQAKVDHRKKLAEEMGIALNALRIRAHRIRTSLEQCIDKCLTRDSTHEMDRDYNPY